MRVFGVKALVLMGMFLPLLAACSNGKETVSTNDSPADAGSSKSDSVPVLVMVDGSPITELQLEQAMDRFFSDQAAVKSRQDVERKVLRSLVSSRAISRLAGKELTAVDRQALNAKVDAYREELLVKEYLQTHAEPQPVTSEMVEAYYEKHKDEFGGGTSNSFELVQTTRQLDGDERKKLIELVGGLAAVEDWQKWSEKHSALPIGWRRLEARTELMKQPLKSLVASTEVGMTSALHIGDQLTIVRVNARAELPAKPLMQVSSEIRRKLAPIMMKEAIREISAEAEKKLEIEIVDQEYQGITEG